MTTLATDAQCSEVINSGMFGNALCCLPSSHRVRVLGSFGEQDRNVV